MKKKEQFIRNRISLQTKGLPVELAWEILAWKKWIEKEERIRELSEQINQAEAEIDQINQMFFLRTSEARRAINRERKLNEEIRLHQEELERLKF